MRARAVELTSTAERARKLLCLWSGVKHRLILYGPAEVFGKVLYLAPTQSGRRSLDRLVRRAMAEPQLTWGDLLHAAAIGGGHGCEVANLAVVPHLGIVAVPNCSVVVERIEEQGENVTPEALRSTMVAWSEAR